MTGTFDYGFYVARDIYRTIKFLNGTKLDIKDGEDGPLSADAHNALKRIQQEYIDLLKNAERYYDTVYNDAD